MPFSNAASWPTASYACVAPTAHERLVAFSCKRRGFCPGLRAHTAEELQVLLTRIIKRLLKFLTRKGYLIEEQGMTYLGDTGPETALGPRRAGGLHLPHCARPRAGQKVLSFQTISTREPPPTPVRCVDAQGFSLHAEVCCAAHERKKLEHLCRYITRPAIANERLAPNRTGQVVLTLKTPYRDGTTHIVMSPLEFLQRLAALVPRPRLHLIRFHGVLAPEARPREGPAWRAEDAAPGCVPRSFHPSGAKQATSLCLAFRTCRSTSIPPQRTTLRCPLPRRLPP